MNTYAREEDLQSVTTLVYTDESTGQTMVCNYGGDCSPEGEDVCGIETPWNCGLPETTTTSPPETTTTTATNRTELALTGLRDYTPALLFVGVWFVVAGCVGVVVGRAIGNHMRDDNERNNR